MARRGGPKKKPLAIIKLHGSNHLYRRKDNDLKAPVSIPIMPDWLSQEASLEWKRVTPMLAELGILSPLDRAVLTAYCEGWSQYKAAKEYCSKLLIKNVAGNIVKNPAVGIMNKALQLMSRAAAELGMTPSARADLAKPQENQEEKGAHFFKKWGPCGLS